ncbi:Na+/H+ antiporter subunit D, partial [candidate division KSB1 bacterium]|nr:Na+/H+ antiporter subunit D [candidate division KSB1 bacterium]
TFKLKELGGLYQIYPYLGILFLIPALSLSGIPPLSGFFAKFSLIKAGLEAEQYYIVATALGVSLLTVFSMTKIWAEVFWKPEPSKLKANTVEISTSGTKSYFLLLLPIITLAVLTVFIGLAAESVFSLAEQAAAQLLNPAEYILAVLGEKL